MSDIVLTSGIRQNLLSLQKTASLLSTTQSRLATGKKVNTALDNAVNFFTASGLDSRAGDLTSLLDAMSNGIKTIEAADHGLTSITKMIQSMQSTLMQARQDSSWKSASYSIDSATIATTTAKNLTFSGGAVTGLISVPVNTATVAATVTSTGAIDYTANPDLSALVGQTVSINGSVVYTFTGAAAGQAAALKAAIDASSGGATYVATLAATGVNIARADGTNFTVTTSNAAAATSIGIPNNTTTVNGVVGSVKTVDQLVTAINADLNLIGKVKASNDAGSLRITNLSTTALDLIGITGSAIDGGGGAAQVAGNDVRVNLVSQFNELRDQLDKLSDDSSYMGVNLLQGDLLKVLFNELATSTLNIQSRDPNGNPFVVNSANLNINSLVNSDLDSNTNIDTLLANLRDSLQMVRAQASNFGSNLSIVQMRQDFTKSLVNTLTTGADNLVLADQNEEGANILALQTRQQLSITALSLSSQASQSVLKLFG